MSQQTIVSFFFFSFALVPCPLPLFFMSSERHLQMLAKLAWVKKDQERLARLIDRDTIDVRVGERGRYVCLGGNGAWGPKACQMRTCAACGQTYEANMREKHVQSKYHQDCIKLPWGFSYEVLVEN